MSGLVVSAVDVRIDGQAIVQGADFSAEKGAVTGLIGPNGAGKSTLMSALAGLRRMMAGGIAFDGADLAGMAGAERAQICAYVEQFASTTERLSVRDVVGLGRVPFQSTWQSRPSVRDLAVVDEALGALGLTDFAPRLYHTLSGGQQQRVQIARALAQEPQLLLLDEPTSHLDIQAQLRVLSLLRGRAAGSSTVVLALHDLNLAARFCDHLVVMQGGKVVAQGSPDVVLDAALLRDVYGVEASIMRLPGHGYPIVVYEQASEGISVQKSD